MSEAVFEFPLKEKVRNYLRVEQLLGQLKSTAKSDSVLRHEQRFRCPRKKSRLLVTAP